MGKGNTMVSTLLYTTNNTNPPVKMLAGSFKGRLRGENYEGWLRRRVAAEVKNNRWVLNYTLRQAIAIGMVCPVHCLPLEANNVDTKTQKTPHKFHYECPECWDEAMAFQIGCRKWWRMTIMKIPEVFA